MEFKSRKACIDYYSNEYAHLPRYMIEMAFDYDQHISKQKLTGAEKTKAKTCKTY